MELAIELVDSGLNDLDIARAIEGEVIEINMRAKILSMHMTNGAIQKLMDKAETFDSLVESGLINKEILEEVGYKDE